MDALELLLTRHSQPRLQAPAPHGLALQNIMAAALRAPDHAGLRPWRFVVCEGQGLKKLGEIFSDAAKQSGMDDKDIERASQMPLRAPMVIVTVAKYQQHDKVPWVEQVASAACAVHAMQMTAYAQGFAGIWRTGSYAQNPHVRKAFALAEKDEIVGFLYLGSAATQALAKPQKALDEHFEIWQ